MSPPNPKLTEHFEANDGYAILKLSGNVTLEAATEAVSRAIVAARDHGIKRLLVDGTELTGFSSPSVAERYFIVRDFAVAGESSVELSLALQQQIIDPDRFGIIVATNMGMRANAFSSPSEALTWLLSGNPSI